MVSPYQPYLDALQSPDALARRDASVALSALGPGVLPPLIDLLKGMSAFYYEANDRYASDIARAIGLTLYPEIAVPQLIEALTTSPDPLARKEASQALRFIGLHTKDAVLALIALLNGNEDPRTRRDAAVALGTIGKTTPAAIHQLIELLEATLIELLEATDAQSRMGGARALGMLAARSSRARLALTAASQSADAAVRIRAATSLAVIENTTADLIPSLLSSLRAAEVDVRLESALALKMVEPGPSAIKALVAALRDEGDAFVRSEIVSVLGGIEDGGSVVVGHLATALINDPEGRVREAAAEALRLIGPPSARQAVLNLISALKDPDAAVRELAALALQNLGASASSAASALRFALHDPNPAVQIRQRSLLSPLHGATSLMQINLFI